MKEKAGIELLKLKNEEPMRIYLKISANNAVIPFNHQAILTGTIHKWLGPNEDHGKVSLYSFSRLDGAKVCKTGLQFNKESSFFFSAYDADLIKGLVKGIQADPSMFHGLSVSEVIIQEDPDFSDRELFPNASPVFIKRRVGERIEHILYTDERANACLKETILTKMSEAGLSDDNFEIAFDTSYNKAGTKKVTYNGTENRASWCSVIVKGSPEVKRFIWNVGLGNSTGIGFGAIK